VAVVDKDVLVYSNPTWVADCDQYQR
jgi:hypothetical protein